LRTVSTFTVVAPSGSNKTAESAEFEVYISLRDIRDPRRDLHCEAVFRDGAGLIAGKDDRSIPIADGPNSVRFIFVEPAEVIDDKLSGRPHLEVGKLPVYGFIVAYRVGTPNATGWRVRVADDQALDEKGNLLYQYTAEQDAVENASTTDTEQEVRGAAISRTSLPAGTRTLGVIAKLIAPGNIVVATTRYDLPVREAPLQAAQKTVPTGASQIAFTPLPARLNFTSNQRAGTATVEEYAGHIGATLSAAAPAETDEAALTAAAAEAVAAAPVSKLIPLKKYWAVYNDLDEGTFTASLSFTYNLADFPPLPGFNEDTLVLAGLNPLSGELEALPTTLDRTARTAMTAYLKFFEVCTLAFNVNARTAVSVSAASYRGFDFAVESINAAFGENLATATQVATSIPLPTELAGTRVLVRDSAGTERLAPLFFVSPNQVNYQIPPGTAAGAATVIISSGDGALSTGTINIVTVAAGLFAANADGQGAPAAYVVRVRSDGTQINEAITRFDPTQNKFVLTPLDLGPPGEQVVLVLFGTGFRAVSSPATVSVQIGGENTEVLYAGTQGGFVGLDQLNLLVPRALAGRGEVELVVTINGKAANPLKLNLK
jgi:uncharacterized protein (TIGR03437 family)